MPPLAAMCANSMAEHMILRSAAGLTPIHLNMLVYFSHAWTLALLGRRLIAEGVEAWEYGPVVPSVYHAFLAYGQEEVRRDEYFGPAAGALERAHGSMFGAGERSIMGQVLGHYGAMTGPELLSITNRPGGPWDRCRDRTRLFSRIGDDVIAGHYRALKAAGG